MPGCRESLHPGAANHNIYIYIRLVFGIWKFSSVTHEDKLLILSSICQSKSLDPVFAVKISGPSLDAPLLMKRPACWQAGKPELAVKVGGIVGLKLEL